MRIELPDLTIQDDWTIPGQIKKILEEAGEVAEAIAEDDPVQTVKEALDVMQTCLTLIRLVDAEWGSLNINKFLTEHEKKLERKGYL